MIVDTIYLFPSLRDLLKPIKLFPYIACACVSL